MLGCSIGGDPAGAHSAIQLAGYRHFSARVADATGIELEKELRPPDRIAASFSYAGESASGRLRAPPPIGRVPPPRPPAGQTGTTGEAAVPLFRSVRMERALADRPAVGKALEVLARLLCDAETAHVRLVLSHVASWLEHPHWGAAPAPVTGQRAEVLLAFARKLSFAQSEIQGSDCEELLAAGLTEEEVVTWITRIAWINAWSRMDLAYRAWLGD